MPSTELIITLAKKRAVKRLHALGFDDYRNEMYLEKSWVVTHHITVVGQKKNIPGIDLSEFEYDLEQEWYVLIKDRVKILIHD